MERGITQEATLSPLLPNQPPKKAPVCTVRLFLRSCTQHTSRPLLAASTGVLVDRNFNWGLSSFLRFPLSLYVSVAQPRHLIFYSFPTPSSLPRHSLSVDCVCCFMHEVPELWSGKVFIFYLVCSSGLFCVSALFYCFDSRMLLMREGRRGDCVAVVVGMMGEGVQTRPKFLV